MSDVFPPPLVDAALRGMLVALLLLVAARLLRDHRSLPVARIAAAFLLGLVVQVASSLPSFEAHVPLLWQAPLVGISVANAVLFWLFVQALFDDAFVLRPGHALAWLAVVALGAANCAGGWDRASPIRRLAVELQHGVPLLFATLAAIAIVATWRADLVERRRRLRTFIAVTGVVYTIVMLVVRVEGGGRLTAPAALFDTAALLAIVAVAAYSELRIVGSGLLAADGRPVPATVAPASAESNDAPPPPDAEDERLAASLERSIRDDGLHRIEGLTVAGLAARLAVPEYRLRRVINRRLGHRNFNGFINAFRLDEARAALADPAHRKRPVLTIALDAGFQSIGPFNRAFKAATGLTPTEFREKHRADS